jgi:phage terminase small subunit
MATAQDLGVTLLELLKQSPECDVEELMTYCPQATWNQVFLALDQLSRSGQVTLRQQGPGQYKVGPAPQREAASRVLSQQHA